MSSEGFAALLCRISGMTDKLHQMNISYIPKEDRLLLRISTLQGDEFRVWLTRRYTGLLFKILNKQMEKSGGVPTVAASDETRKLFKAGAMEQKYTGDSSNFPLGETGFLAFRINTGESPDGILHLEISPEQGQGITLHLTNPLLYMFTNILNQGIDKAGWQLSQEDTLSMQVH